ncbi:HAD family hydrolase [Ruminococcus sp. XPD3002]|uniref:HAD family hydrolase n=1 Tax=Ruminococcus sp. XPD3002 TaxID=1452269 RepID=UPI000910D1B1|nr:phosphoglycolate phosphatase [Ruminococcus flavefaciens]
MITAIFDLDGTLADSLYDLANAVNYGLDKLGFPSHPYDSYRYFVGNGAAKLCYRALPMNEKDSAERLLELFTEYYSEHYLDETRLYPGIPDVLAELASHDVTLAVATNKPQQVAQKIVRTLLPDTDFFKVLGGCDSRPKKPDITIISEIVNELPSDNEVWMIGDSNVDITTAQNAGIASIGCAWGFRGRRELEDCGADFIAESAEDISRIILR